MAKRTLPGVGLTGFWDVGADYKTEMDANMRKLSALVQPVAKSRTTNLPGSGSTGDIYIVPSAAGSNPNQIAVWDGETGSEAWVYLVPQEGWTVYVEDTQTRVAFDGSVWTADTVAGSDLVAAIDTYFGNTEWRDATMFKGVYLTKAALDAAHPTGSVGNYAFVDAGASNAPVMHVWDGDDNEWAEMQGGGGGTMSGAQIEAALDTYYGNTNWRTPGSGGGIADAPSDGKQYARKDGTWSEVVGGGGLGTPESPAYSNVGGQGDRQLLIGAAYSGAGTGSPAKMLDGNSGTGNATAWYFGNEPVQGKSLSFVFNERKLISEITWKQSPAQTLGDWKVQGSDNGVDWVDLSSVFTLGSATTQIIPLDLYAGIGYAQLRFLGVSGNTSSSPWLTEIEFKIGSAGTAIQRPKTVFSQETADFSVTNTHLTGEKHVECPNATVITVPENLSGTGSLEVEATGVGDVSFVAGANVTINSLNGHLKLEGQFAKGRLTPKGNNVYLLTGDLKA